MANEVWIHPYSFFELVGGLRTQTALVAGTAAPTVPYVADEGGRSYLEALSVAVDEARTMMAAHFEIAGRAMVLAGTKVVDADIAESGVESHEQLLSPYEVPMAVGGYDPKYDEAFDDFDDYESQREYNDSYFTFMEERSSYRDASEAIRNGDGD